MSFNFSSAVSSFGAFLNYAPGFGNPMIGAYDSGGNLIEQYNLATDAPISTPGGFNLETAVDRFSPHATH